MIPRQRDTEKNKSENLKTNDIWYSGQSGSCAKKLVGPADGVLVTAPLLFGGLISKWNQASTKVNSSGCSAPSKGKFVALLEKTTHHDNYPL